MMRTSELLEFAEHWGLRMITIRGLQEYRKRRDKLVERVADAALPTRYGSFRAVGFINRLNGEHHVALVKGEIGNGENLLCRVHSECLTGDAFGSIRCDCGGSLPRPWRRLNGRDGASCSISGRKGAASV